MAKQTSPRTSTSAPKKKRVSEPPQPSAAGADSAVRDKSPPSHDDIAQRAFALYQGRAGASGGDPLQDWLTAERELAH